MRFSAVLLTLAGFLFWPAVISTLYLYLYPALFQCGFPEAKHGQAACLINGTAAVAAEKAPLRLLAFGDPQLEGDTSLPGEWHEGWFKGSKDGFWAGIERRGRWVDGLGPAVRGLVKGDVPRLFSGYRKKVDLWGNDLYLAHIYWLVPWWSQPTHIVVLGDLLGSQWIDDGEFRRRSTRFWDKVFKGAEKVSRGVTDVSGKTEVLGQDEEWKRRIIAVAGNHDIGYPGDIDERRIERFEDVYGRVNWDIRFRLNGSSDPSHDYDSSPFSTVLAQHSSPDLRLVVLNSMNLDQPALKPDLSQQSRDFVEHILHSTAPRSNQATVLLTHVPLHKPEGVCVDAPYFSYFPENQGGGIQEQNHLSESASHRILDGLASGGQSIVLNGHDHEGCDTFHHRLTDGSPEPAVGQGDWQAKRWSHLTPADRVDAANSGLREITVRSMMGSYGGNAGLLSAWFDEQDGQWRFEYSTCMLGVQHIWWAAYILDVIVVLCGVSGVVLEVWQAIVEVRQENREFEEAERRKKRA